MKERNFSVCLVFLPLILSGCTALSLERHTANQAMTLSDLRYRLVLNNFAKLARSPGSLPSLATISDGLATVADSGGFDAKTGIDGFKGFTGEALNATGSRSPEGQWTIDPVHTPSQIRAIKAAYEWVLFGRFSDPSIVPTLKDFQVYDDLVAIPCGWVRVSREGDAPKSCECVGHYYDTCAWVSRNEMQKLSEFTLLLADIATLEPASVLPLATVVLTGHNKSQLRKENFQERLVGGTQSNGTPMIANGTFQLSVTTESDGGAECMERTKPRKVMS